jgi:beta-galactosidase
MIGRSVRLGVAGLLVFAAGNASRAQPEAEQPSVRHQINLDAGWRFFAGDEPAASEPAFDDSGWQAVDLPHTWNAFDGQDGGSNYRRGAGWYRRHVPVDSALAGRRLYLQFDGASLMADVYVNGRHLGTHRGGFARFRFDATDVLLPGRDNVVAVRVDNGHLGIPPTSADFTFFGGLYRGVSLLATDPVQIAAMDYGSPGVFITQKKVTPESAQLEVRAELENHQDRAQDVEVRTTVLDRGGAAVRTATTRLSLAPQGAATMVEPLVLDHPHLWNGLADPYLYTVSVEVRRIPPAGGGQVPTDPAPCDAVVQPLGVRFFHVDPDRGFFLNGHYLDLHGVCRHQDRINQGWAISQAEEAEDFALIREIGATAIRVAHYQQAQTWYDRCDRAGLAVWAEIPFVNEALPTQEFLENAKQQLRELIRQNYNHPAIFFWGVGNETSGLAADGFISDLAPVVREEDPTRLSTYASDHPIEDPKNWHTDVVAFNRYYGWYYGEAGDFAQNMDETHARHPHTPFGVSEYGAGGSIFMHEEDPPKPDPNGHFHPEEYENRFHEIHWKILKDRPFVWGKFVWNMFDFASDRRVDGDQPGRNDKGLVTYDRKTRKDAFYWYKANWSEEPVLYITSRRFVARTQPVTDIKIYANAPEVELSVNGVPLEARRAPDHIFLWPGIKLVPGENRISAQARFGDKIVSDECAWSYQPAP